MFDWLFGRRQDSSTPQRLFGQVSSYARSPQFYEQLGFEDTVMGRFDVLSLHIMLLCKHLGGLGDGAAKSLSQEIFDEFILNIDSALRHLGIGDSSVPKKKKKLLHTFYAHVDAFDPAIGTGNQTSVENAVNSRLKIGSQGQMQQLVACHILDCAAGLSDKSFEDICAGKFGWPEPGQAYRQEIAS